MSKFKPVNIVFEAGISLPQVESALCGVVEMLQLAQTPQPIPVRNFGVWRQPGYNQGGALQPYQSVDWYAARGKQACDRANQLDVGVIMHYLENEPWQKHEPHYDVAVFSQDFCTPSTNFVIGLGQAGLGTALSAYRFSGLGEMAPECLKTAVMHELGHVFGLIPRWRTQCVEESLGKHCTNRCLMRQGLAIQNWIDMTRDRLNGPPLCNLCLNDLKNYFRS